MYVSSRQGYKPPVKSTGKVKEYTHFASLKYCNGAETFYTYAPQCRTMARTTTIMSMARASAAMTAAWRLRRHELCRELQRITSKRATYTRRCSSTTIQTIWVAVVTSPTLMARWCNISSMFLSVRFSLRSATTSHGV